jgi:hypothetical protein
VAAKPSRHSINSYYRALWQWLMLRARLAEIKRDLADSEAALAQFNERVMPQILEQHFSVQKTGAKVIPLDQFHVIGDDPERLKTGADWFRKKAAEYGD